jgi:hypothetical protein
MVQCTLFFLKNRKRAPLTSHQLTHLVRILLRTYVGISCQPPKKWCRQWYLELMLSKQDGIDQDDAIIDKSLIDSTYSINRNENLTKNDSDSKLRKSIDKTDDTSKGNNKHTDEEEWTTTTPGRTKPKNNNTVASTESIITTIEGIFET